MIAFSDAVVAIAITLLVLPLVDAASKVGDAGVSKFLDTNGFAIFAFALSFVVIADFWYQHHQLFETVDAYNAVLVWASFIWMFSIVFLPFPTELLGSARANDQTGHVLYVSTLLVTTLASLVQHWAVVHWPALQAEESRGTARLYPSVIAAVLMVAALVLTALVPEVGLYSLLLLLLSTPIERFVRWRFPEVT